MNGEVGVHRSFFWGGGMEHNRVVQGDSIGKNGILYSCQTALKKLMPLLFYHTTTTNFSDS